MFENIQFQQIDFDVPVDLSVPLSVFSPIFAHLDDCYSYFNMAEQSVDFNMVGKSFSICPQPISDFAQTHLLYIRMFSLIDAGKAYYTARKNYPCYLLLYTYEGCGVLEYEGNRYELLPESGFWIDCRKPHRYYTNGDHWLHSGLHFDGITAQWLYEKHTTGNSPLLNIGSSFTYQQKIEKVLFAYQEIGLYREYDIFNCLNNLLLYLVKEKNAAILNVPDHVRKLRTFLEENYKKSLTLDSISYAVGISKYHMDREFKKYTGYSITAYIIELRLNSAKNLLDNTNLAVGKIAQASGFSCYANFLRLFKLRTGQTPAEYRKSKE